MLKAVRITSVILLLCWMTMIFCLSAETADESSSTSGRIIYTVAKIVFPDFDSLDASSQEEIISSFQFITRKTAHFTIYAVLGALAFASVFTYSRIPFGYRLALSCAICLLYSVNDELHQTFVSGRSGELRDVCVDFCGSLLGIAVLGLITRKLKIFKKYI